MPIYKNEKCSNFQRALESVVLEQKIRPSEVLILKDGPLTEDLEDCVALWKNRFHERIKIITLNKHQGLGIVLRVGVLEAYNDIIARMDSDDICTPNRFEKQLSFLKKNPKIDIVGSYIKEFKGNESNIQRERRVPVEHDQIVNYAKKRNPLNHMTVMFRKNSVIEAGNYEHFPGFEDYLLWAKMILKNKKFANIPEDLVQVRVGSGMIKRRGGINYIYNEYKLQKSFLRIGFINILECIRNILIRSTVRLLPSKIRNQFYVYFLRT